MTKVLLVFLALLTLCISEGKAKSPDGHLLLKMCQYAQKGMGGERLNPNDLVLGGHCTGYLTGYRNAGMHARAVTGNQIDKSWFCIPKNIGTEELISTTIQYLESNPSVLSEKFPNVLHVVFTKTFPCKVS